MKTIIVFLLLFNSFLLNAQEQSRYIDLKKLHIKGVVFSESYKIVGNYYPCDQGRVTISDEDIIQAELLLERNLYKKGLTYIKRSVRQYVGLRNCKGERIVLMQLISKKCTRHIKRRFQLDWKRDYVIGHGDYFEKNRYHYLINLDKQIIEE